MVKKIYVSTKLKNLTILKAVGCNDTWVKISWQLMKKKKIFVFQERAAFFFLNSLFDVL
jgi:hypothetical protein